LINFFYGSIFSKKISNFLTLIDFLDFLLLLPGRIYNYHDNYDNNINWLMGKYPDTVGHMSTPLINIHAQEGILFSSFFPSYPQYAHKSATMTSL
jgi:hypothetical protein